MKVRITQICQKLHESLLLNNNTSGIRLETKFLSFLEISSRFVEFYFRFAARTLRNVERKRRFSVTRKRGGPAKTDPRRRSHPDSANFLDK